MRISERVRVPITLRTMTSEDLPQVLAVQASCYPPELRDGAAAFLSRLVFQPTTNLVAETAEGISAYLLSHPWRRGSPPPLDTELPPRDGPSDCWFIQDLSVSPDHRGSGLAHALYAAGREVAAGLALCRSELIAVQDADAFWRSLGYRAVTASSGLAHKLASYGPSATYMARDL